MVNTTYFCLSSLMIQKVYSRFNSPNYQKGKFLSIVCVRKVCLLDRRRHNMLTRILQTSLHQIQGLEENRTERPGE